MPPKKLTKTQISRFSCADLALKCQEWKVEWPDGEDDFVVRAELWKKVRAVDGAHPPAPKAATQGPAQIFSLKPRNQCCCFVSTF